MKPHILITGASSGIGEALALEMASRGLAVGLIARRERELASLCERIESQGGTSAWATADVTNLDNLLSAVQSIEAQLGPASILVANAGISGRSPASDPDLSRIKKVMDVNFTGAIHATMAVLPHMMARKSGHLVVVSSVAGFRGLPKSSAYSASKAAISTYWESLRVELQPHGIAATTINPGYIKTPLTDKNNHPMPFIITAEKAAKIMANGILARRKVITFPGRMRWVMRLMRFLPVWLFDRLMRQAGDTYR